MVSAVDSVDQARAATPKMDTARLRSHVFEQTGIRIDTSDPVFALVALNDAVLAEGVERQRAIIDEVAERIAGQADELLEAGERYKRQVQRGGVREGGADTGAVVGGRQQVIQLAAMGAATALLTALLTVIGLNVFGKAPPAPIVMQAAGGTGEPAALTAEQILAMQNGEKFVKVLSKLDAKTQAHVLELMRQP
jgi:hypothetical protein